MRTDVRYGCRDRPRGIERPEGTRQSLCPAVAGYRLRGPRGVGRWPRSRSVRRVDLVEGGHVLAALEEQSQASMYRSEESLVFCHPALGTPLDPSKLSRYARKALAAAGITKPFRPFHDLRRLATYQPDPRGRGHPAGLRADARRP